MPQNADRVAIYCRLSEEDRHKIHSDDDSESIKNQKLMLTEYAINHDWRIVDIYSDDDFTGSDRNRPEFNRLLKDAETGKIDIVLCKTQSRFTRELEIVEKYLHYLFPLWGVRFVSVVDNADTDNKGNKKSRQINGLINEWYLEDMSDNIKAVLTNRRKNGFFIGAFAPYGYQKDPNLKGHLIIDDEAALVIRRIFDLYTKGIGCSSIARIFNEEGVIPPSEYKVQKGFQYKNRYTKSKAIWRYFMINSILSNEVYIGNLVQNKAHSVSYKTHVIKPTDKSEWIKVENTHEPIIDIDTWNIVQNIKSNRAVVATHNYEPNVFSKKLICCNCGNYMKMSISGGRRYFRCGTRYYDKNRCGGNFISYYQLYKVVLERLQNHIQTYANIDTVESEVSIKDNYNTNLKILRDNLNRTKAKYDESVTANKNLYLDKLKGIIDESMYVELSHSFRSDIEKYDNGIKEIEQKISQIETEMNETKSKLEIIKNYVDCKELTFEIVQLFIDKIVVNPSVKYSRKINIDIYWNF